MPFHSILFTASESSAGIDRREAPTFFADLNLDQVVDSITAGRHEYNLKPFFYAPLARPDDVSYRHEVLRDLEDEELLDHVRSFARKLRLMREHLAQAAKLRYRHQKESWFLDAVGIYCDAVGCLTGDLAGADLRSHGLLAFRTYLGEYARSDRFTSLRSEVRTLDEALSRVRYCLHIRGGRVHVTRYDSEENYSAEVEDTFTRFKQGAVKDRQMEFSAGPEMNHVEARVLDLVAQLYSDVFSSLGQFCDRRRTYLDPAIAEFDREVQFYIAYLEYVARFRSAGLRFCYPRVSDESKEVRALDTFDVALAGSLLPDESRLTCNDFSLKDPERIFVVSGPNQGGKTTFARMFGQLHYLASLGCLVPGSEAQLFLFDHMFTHFEKEEDLKNLSGKLQDDLTRIHRILGQATSNSVVIMNEIFTSTTLRDALLLGQKVLEQIVRLDLLCVCVTFVDELASLGETTVSAVSTVEPTDPALRTYKIVRRPADGLAYAAAIAEKYGLTYERLKGRIAS